MEQITLKAISEDGAPLEATFAVSHGMNLNSYKRGEIEVMDQTSRKGFEEKSAGMGALIGPHFHRRPPESIPSIPHEERFPNIAVAKAAGSAEPFSHGIARYAPWKAEATETKIVAKLSGKDEWNGVKLADLEGQNFEMSYTAELKPDGLHIDLGITSETDSLVGTHFYYALSDGQGSVTAKVQDTHRTNEAGWVPLPKEWDYSDNKTLRYPLTQETDFGFHPFPDPLNGEILLETASHKLTVKYHCENEENEWQLWHPQGAPFVCIEPMTAANPRKPILSVSSLHLVLAITEPLNKS